ncbi:hypothetical protein KNO15_22015 [Leifsonia shinshuensis]|uniref:hypothetical protein n=1 Tax=Leifsonia shinshuensis TaxID=150026 RepID=UPI001F5080C9|nr:hypothetical protein [Leifsonia shinshuensis]MCI0159387.1 hypothetical protein [Leifsonia shinshuensis]
MNTPHTRRAILLRWTIGLLTTGLLGSVFLLTPAASAAPVTAPLTAPDGLSIAITDGVAETASGASSDYTVTVTNRGTSPVTGELVVTLPEFATFSKAEGSHREKADAVWKVTVAPGASERRHASAAIGRIPATAVRVTTLATWYAEGDRSRILVRAADANAIQGVLDPAHTVGQSPQKVGAAPKDPTFLIVGVSACVVLLALAIVGFVVLRRRRRESVPVQTREG